MAAELVAKATPKVIELVPKACKVGQTFFNAANVNAALNVYKAANDYHKEHHKPPESTGPTKDGQSSDHQAEEGRSRHRHHRRPSEADNYSEPAYGQAQQGQARPLPYPDSDYMPMDPSLYVYNKAQPDRRGSQGSRRDSITPTPGTADQDRQNYFGDQAMKGHEQALREARNAGRRRSSVDQRRMSASFDRSINPPPPKDRALGNGEEGRRIRSRPDRGYLKQGLPTAQETYPAYPPPRRDASKTNKPPMQRFYGQPKNGAERMLNLVAAADRGIPIPPPPIPLPRRDSTTGNIPSQRRPPMPSRISSSGRRASLASSTGSGASSRSNDSRYGYSDMV